MLVIGRSYGFDSIHVGITKLADETAEKSGEGRTKFAEETTERSDDETVTGTADAGTDAGTESNAETAGTKAMA